MFVELLGEKGRGAHALIYLLSFFSLIPFSPPLFRALSLAKGKEENELTRMLFSPPFFFSFFTFSFLFRRSLDFVA